MNKQKIFVTLRDCDAKYAKGISPLSDYEYDKLRAQAELLWPDDPYFKEVGHIDEGIGEKVDLPYIIGSLTKTKPENVDKWLSTRHKCPNGRPIIVSEKLDGMSFYCEVDDYKLVFAATRGDGYTGRNILPKLSIIFPKWHVKGHFCLRGEILLKGEQYKELGFKNRRNAVAGIINTDDNKEVHRLSLVFYELISWPDELDFNSEISRLIYMLNILKLDLARFKYFGSGLNSKSLVECLKEFKEKTVDYDIDGLVLTSSDYEREDVMYPENKVAFKVNQAAIMVNVIDVDWQIGRTGKLTPVVLLDPTEMGGITVSKVSAFNFKQIYDSQIGPGAVIGIVRSGDVIPYITEVFKTYKRKSDKDVPGLIYDNGWCCPKCGEKLKSTDVDVYCENPNCNRYRKIEYFFRSMGAETLSEKTFINLNVKSFKEIFELTEFEISMIDGYGIKRGQQIVEEIYKCLECKEETLLTALGIPGVGKETSTKIMQVVTFDDLMYNTHNALKKITDIDGIGPSILESLRKITKYEKFYKFLQGKGLKFKTPINNTLIKGKIFAITGKSPTGIRRENYAVLIEDRGGFVKGVTKKTDFLVTNDINSNKGKAKKARQYGIQMISYEELEDMLSQD